MAAPIVRPLSVRIRLDADLQGLSSDEVLASVLSCVDSEDISCFTRIRRDHYQVTVSRDQVKEQLMLQGIDLQGRHVTCTSVQQYGPPRPHLTALTILMPFEMDDDHVIPILSTHGRGVEVRRLKHRRYPNIETGVRLFKLEGVEDPSRLPSYVTIGHYNMVVRLCGSFVRKCYRCRSTQHLVKDCPEPDTRTRDIEQASASVEDPDADLRQGLDLNDPIDQVMYSSRVSLRHEDVSEWTTSAPIAEEVTPMQDDSLASTEHEQPVQHSTDASAADEITDTTDVNVEFQEDARPAFTPVDTVPPEDVDVALEIVVDNPSNEERTGSPSDTSRIPVPSLVSLPSPSPRRTMSVSTSSPSPPPAPSEPEARTFSAILSTATLDDHAYSVPLPPTPPPASAPEATVLISTVVKADGSKSGAKSKAKRKRMASPAIVVDDTGQPCSAYKHAGRTTMRKLRRDSPYYKELMKSADGRLPDTQ